MNTVDLRTRARWTIFCKVVDNLGDIGVCWRLARTLSRDHGRRVELWVDDLEAFFRLCPETRTTSDHVLVDGVQVRLWRDPFVLSEPADVVIEAFSCDPPPTYVRAMAEHRPVPLWINLEYLSAEAWVGACHRKTSPHPRLPLTKYFFFPGFGSDTGGLLREPDLLASRDRFRASPDRRAAFLRELGLADSDPDTLTLSLFAYAQPVLGSLLQEWAAGPRAIRLLVPEGRIVADLARHLGVAQACAGDRFDTGAVTIEILPFLAQSRYDRLLWSCDLNFVRGEDSFVRALWAARPFVWQIYRQAGEAHEAKLLAFLQRYTAGLDESAKTALRNFWHAWNGCGDPAACWNAFAQALVQLEPHARAWSDAQATQEDLASALVKFCETIVK